MFVTKEQIDMKIVISGATGFVGSELCKIFSDKKFNVIPLNRSHFRDGSEENLRSNLQDCDIVINLAGAPINHRWTRNYKKVLYESRINVTHKLVSAINTLDRKPKLMISASAVGYYPSEGCFDEYNSTSGDSFLANLCFDWEKESQNLSPGIRLVNSRFGVILAKQGGAFEKMIASTKIGIATIIGKGQQAFPWISLSDLVKGFEFIIENPNIYGIVNFTTPKLINNKDFTENIAKNYHCFCTIRIPIFLFKILMGESSSFLLEGQSVFPSKLLNAGFIFRNETIEQFLNS